MAKEERILYSYHTFIYPFLYDDHGKIDQDAFKDKLSNNWKDDNIVNEYNQLVSVLDKGRPKDQREDYRSFQYFNTAARKALFGADGEIVSNYKLDLHEDITKDDRLFYTIKIQLSDDNTQSYDLDVNAIRLKIFNTGVAAMIFELEYYLPEGKTREDARIDVKLINEFGRRMYPEYMPENPKYDNILCAEELCLKRVSESGKQQILSKDNFRERCKDKSYLKDPSKLPDLIEKLLWGESNNYPTLEPAIDSRMFVCCLIRDQAYVQQFLGYPPFGVCAQRHQAARWKFMTDWKTAQELYAVTNIDKDSDSSCQSRLLLNEYFTEQLYSRWIEYGTLHSVTNHSMVCLTSEYSGVDSSVVDPFLTLYTQMCILVLVQRATLISFDEKITKISEKNLGHSRWQDELVDLQKKFAVFQGQLLLQEITPQIQGIEIYQRLQKMLFINNLEANIQKQVNNLFEITEATQGDKLNRYGVIFAVSALVLAVWQAREAFGQSLAVNVWHIFYAVVFSALGTVVLCGLWKLTAKQRHIVYTWWKKLRKRWDKD